MNAIELTEQHRSMLLEMCKALFPEYSDIFIYPDKENTLVLRESNTIIYIHWFEFCMLHLTSTLAFNFAKTDIVMDIEWETFVDKVNNAVFKDSKHPITFLYEQFKRLS